MASCRDAEGGAPRSPRDADAHDDADGRSTKRQRMDRLIQMSLEFAGVLEPRRSPPSTINSGERPMAIEEQHRQTGAGGQPTASADQHHTSDTTQAPQGSALVRKRTWTAAEDAKLVGLVARLGRNWAAIAREFPAWDRKRCRERFINHLDPALRRELWTPAEDDRLLELHRSIGSHWASVAGELEGRSPDDAKNRWLQLTKASSEAPSRAPPQRWTESETNALLAAVEAHGAKDWFFIASHIVGRTDLQCRQHWHRVLAPRVVKGRATWTREEDTLLQSKVEELGPQWEKIAAFLPGRMGKQCRERYVNHLDDAIVKTPWTEREDSVLRDAEKITPRKWSKIAQHLPGRSENAIKNRWNSLRRTTTSASSQDAM